MAHASSVRTYYRLTQEQFAIHRISNHMDAINSMTKYSNCPAPGWLQMMVMMLYKQTTEIRLHAERNCRKIHTPDSDFSLTVRMWYN